MPLAPGTRLGVFEVAAIIGAGGMGEVYRARDTKLKREVAIKVLPEAFARDPDRLARFQREAEVLASLNHPNIAAIYGLERSGGTTALVMELVEGPTLAEIIAGSRLSAMGSSQSVRPAEGPGPRAQSRHALPLDEALSIAKQIAEALEAAHERGIVHRDLKPANVKLRPDGVVKVLDFGLAKALEQGKGEAGGGKGDLALSQSPTITTPAMTQAGLILGTAAYMSPEQARGKPVDRRADIWAFGVVLFEMLTARRAFEGDDISITLAAVMMKEPDWRALPASTPSGLRRLLTRCLKKDPKARMRDIGEARLQIEELLSGAPEEAGVPATPHALPLWQRALPWTSTGALAAGLALVLALWAPWQTLPPPAPLRLSAELGADASLVTDPGAATALSPDGGVLAFVARQSAGGRSQLYVRRLEQLQAAPLSGTVGGTSPFFSPDGQWIGFFADGKLKKISVTGGAAVTLCDAPNGRGGTWAEDGTIAFTPDIAPGVSVLRVSSAGGKPDRLTTVDNGEVTQRWPQILPGGKAVLFTAHTGVTGFDDANLVVQALPAGARKVVQRGGYYGRYLPSGHLVYIHEGTLFAAPFDLDRLELTGQPVPALEGVTAIPRSGGAEFAVSGNGTLVYLPGRNSGMDVPIEWMDRQGNATPLRAMPANWFNLVFAPDGRRLALDISDGQQTDVWTYEWERDSLSRLTLGPGSAQKPVWTPDGRRIVFGSTRGDTGALNLYWQRADGTGEVQRLTDSKNSQGAWSWHPNGKFLAFHERNPQAQDDVLILPIEGDEASGWKPGKPMVFLNSPFAERAPMFSPDGRWLAYQSTESGPDEVYVRPFPGPGSRWKISTGGGTTPTWSRARRELLFEAPDQRIMVSPYTVEGHSFRPEKPVPWSESRFVARRRIGPTRSFDLHPDGNRVALATLSETQAEAKQDTLVFIFNFFDELRRIAPRP